MDPVWKSRDYYELLEVSRSATPEEIEAAKRLQSAAWHPDRFTSDAVTQRFQAIQTAHSALSDRQQRLAYDATLLPDPKGLDVFPDPRQRVGIVWKRLAAWMKTSDTGSKYLRMMAYSAGNIVDRHKQPSEKQLPYMLEAWAVAIAAGFDPDAALDE